jgi:hypothetical protein
MDALRQGGCPICRLADEASQSRLQALFYELVNDLPTRERLREGGAFCPRHTRQALRIGDPLGGSIIYADLLRRARDANPSEWRTSCLLCDHEAEVVRGMLKVLLDHIEEDDVCAAYRASDGLCLAHLRQARAHSRRPETLRLAALERDIVAGLAKQCDGFVAKSDYRNSQSLCEGEGDAWRRAARKLGGGYPDRET